jgi:hypothetical protein
VGLREEAGDDAGAEPPRAGVRDVLAGQQPQEVRLARAVGPQDGDPVAVPDLRSNGRIRPVSPSCSAMTARTPVRPPRSRIATRCSGGRSGGGPSASNLASRVCAARYREAMSGELAACCCSVRTSSTSRACSSSQRRRSSAIRSCRAVRACA